MRRNLGVMLITLGVLVLFGGFVYGVLVAGRVSEPAAVTVQGLTPRRAWATGTVVLSMAGVIVGGRAVTRRAGRFGAMAAVAAGGLAVVSGGLNVAIANGGPGTGNGVVGGAAAFVLGLAALALGGRALVRTT